MPLLNLGLCTPWVFFFLLIFLNFLRDSCTEYDVRKLVQFSEFKNSKLIFTYIFSVYNAAELALDRKLVCNVRQIKK